MDSYWILGRKVNKEDLFDMICNIYYFSYVINYPVRIGKKGLYNSDVGWGCTIRSMQMLLCNVMGELGVIKEKELINLFYKINSILSIHNIVKKLNTLGVNEGIHLGSYLISSSINKIMEGNEDFNLHMSEDSMLSVEKMDKKKKSIILVTNRFGIDNLLCKNYYNLLTELFKFSNFGGFVGGINKSSYYFYGINKEELIYFDPHYIMNYNDGYDNTMGKELKSVNLKRIDPTITLCFYYKNEEEYSNVIEFLKDKNIVTVGEKNNFDVDFVSEDDNWEMVL